MFPNIADLCVRGGALLPFDDGGCRGRPLPLTLPLLEPLRVLLLLLAMASMRALLSSTGAGSGLSSATRGVCCHHTEVGVLSSREVAELGDSGAETIEPERARGDEEMLEDKLLLLLLLSEVVLPRLCDASAEPSGKLLQLVSSSLSKASCEA